MPDVARAWDAENTGFPETEFEFIAAGIPSMGSTPGAFRLERDILSKGKIDLLFVEAAVNDPTNGRLPTEQIRGMEGIIRQQIRFKSSSAEIQPRSDALMREIAERAARVGETLAKLGAGLGIGCRFRRWHNRLGV